MTAIYDLLEAPSKTWSCGGSTDSYVGTENLRRATLFLPLSFFIFSSFSLRLFLSPFLFNISFSLCFHFPLPCLLTPPLFARPSHPMLIKSFAKSTTKRSCEWTLTDSSSPTPWSSMLFLNVDFFVLFFLASFLLLLTSQIQRPLQPRVVLKNIIFEFFLLISTNLLSWKCIMNV